MALKGTKALLVWSQRCTEGYKDVKVENMTKSWRDGLAFCAIIHHFRPDLILTGRDLTSPPPIVSVSLGMYAYYKKWQRERDFYSLSKDNVRETCSLAFEIAERELGIPALLDPEDMAAMQVPDKLSIMTYVSQYYNFFKDKKSVNEGSKSKLTDRLSLKRSSLRMKKSKDKDKDGGTPVKQVAMGDKCKMCGRHVYLVERQVVDGKLFHRACFKCNKCNTTLRPGSYKTTKDPKKFECIHHSQESSDFFKYRSRKASQTAASRLAGNDGDDDALMRVQRSSNKGPSGTGNTVIADTGTKPTLHPAVTAQVGPVRPTTQPSAAPIKPSTQPPTRPASKPPAIPSDVKPPSSAIPLHPHLLAAASARNKFAGGVNLQTGTSQMPLAPPQSKTRPLSRETCIDDVTEGSLMSSGKSIQETNIDGPMEVTSKETSIDKPSDANGNTAHDTTADSMSLKSGTTDTASVTSKDDMTISQDSLLKSTNTSVVSFEDEQSIDINIRDVNMNAEKSSYKEKGLISMPSTNKEVDKGCDDKEINKKEVGYGDNETFIEEKKTEKWESESVKEDIQKMNNIGDVYDNKLNTVSEGTKETAPELTINTLNTSMDEQSKLMLENRESTNPFGEDDEDDKEVTEEKTVAKLEITPDEEIENKKNKKETIDIDSNPSGDSKEATNDAKTSSIVEMDRLAVQTKDMDDTKSVTSVDDIYDNDLNPFGDEDDVGDEEKSYNPFDESESVEDEEYDHSLNPFSDDEDEAEFTSNGLVNPFTGSPINDKPPVSLWGETRPRANTDQPTRSPPPRATQDQSSLYQVKTRQQILQEMHVNRETIKKKKSKRPAPRRPPPADHQENASPSSKTDAVELQRRKTRKAPAPPSPGGSPQKTPLKRSPAPSLSPAGQNGGRPTPSPRLSLRLSDSGLENSSPGQSPRLPRPKFTVTPDIQGSSDIEDKPVPSLRRSRRATTSVMTSKHSTSSSPSRLSVSKRKAPLPPAIKRDVTKDHEDPANIQKQLTENEKQQRDLEQTGIELEQKLRESMKEDYHDNEDVLLEWFKLVNDRNKLIRKEGEYIAQIQMQELEVQHADLEYELRCLMNKQEHERVDADKEKEERLLEMLVEVVTRRSCVVDRLEADRLREEEEDENIRQMMEESGLTKESKEKVSKKKKNKKKKEKAIWHVS